VSSTEGEGQAYHPLSRTLTAIGGIDPKYDPTDFTGRQLDTAGQIVGGGGVTNARAIPAALGALAGKEVGYQVAPNNPWVQAAASTVGGGAGGAAGLMRPTVGSTAARMLAQVTPEHKALAAQLVQGGHVTVPEALAQVTGSTTAPKIQRAIETSTGGSEVMGPYMAARPAKNDALVSALMDKIVPDQAVRDPYSTPGNVVDAAGGVIKDASQARTAAVNPLYAAAKQQVIPSDQMGNLVNNVVGKAVEVGTQTKLGQALMGIAKKLVPDESGMPETNIGVLDNIHDEINQAVNPSAFDPNALTGKQQAVIGGQNAQLAQILRGNPTYDQAQNLYASLTKNTVAPLQNSPIGQLADIGSEVTPQTAMTKVSSVLAPADPRGVINPDQIAFTAAKLADKSPNALPDFARQHIESAWDEANRSASGSAPQFSGYRFATKIAGNDQQAANLTALVKGAAGQDAADGMSKVLDIFRAQGNRMAEGSPTELNRQMTSEMSGGSVVGAFTKPGSSLSDFMEKMRLAKNSREMANLITSKDGISKLEQVSRAVGQRAAQAGANAGAAALAANRYPLIEPASSP
jgi:hypothetical protein